MLKSDQFQKFNGAEDEIMTKTDKQINNSLQYLIKPEKNGIKVYQILRSIGSQTARHHGLARIHKKYTPLRPVLSIPGSSYENLNWRLAPFCQKLLAQSLKQTQNMIEKLESRSLKDSEQIVTLDVKRLYNNLPVREAIEIALRELYSRNLVPQMLRSEMKCLLRLTVTNVYFICDLICYVQSYGLAMDASLSVLLANFWMK